METSRSVFAAIVGKPNVGKSSLLNTIIGEKIAIVSPKPQTTRTRITGIFTQGSIQYVFLDTPGLLQRSRNKLGDYMVKQTRESTDGVDVILMVVEPQGKLSPAEENLLEAIRSRKEPAFLVINKIDTLKNREAILERIAFFKEQFEFAEYLPISARTGAGVPELLKEIEKYSIESPHFFPDDEITDQPEKVMAAEMVREKLLYNMQDEIPHGVGVVVESMKERSNKDLMDVEATIYCERKTHKSMIIGKQGTMIKKIGQESREEMERFFQIRVNLQLWVKVKENWRNKEGVMRSLGYSAN